MLLNRSKQRKGQDLLSENLPKLDSGASNPKEKGPDTSFNIQQHDHSNQLDTSDMLMKSLFTVKRNFAFDKIPESDFSPMAIQEDNPFKKRVENYFKTFETVDIQQKLRVLAPSRVNDFSILNRTRQDYPVWRPVSVTTQEKQPQTNKKASVTSSYNNRTNSVNKKHRLVSAGTRREPQKPEEEEANPANKFILTAQKLGKASRNRSSSQDLTQKMQGKRTHARRPSDMAINKSTTMANEAPNFYATMTNIRDSVEDQKLRDSVDSNMNLNFGNTTAWKDKFASAKNEENMPKEGSLLRYFRAQSVKPRPHSHRRNNQKEGRARTPGPDVVPEQDTFQQRAQTAQTRVKSAGMQKIDLVHRMYGKHIGSVNTSLDESNILDSYRLPLSNKDKHAKRLDSADILSKKVRNVETRPGTSMTRPGTSMTRPGTSMGMNNSLYSTIMNRKSIDSEDDRQQLKSFYNARGFLDSTGNSFYNPRQTAFKNNEKEEDVVKSDACEKIGRISGRGKPEEISKDGYILKEYSLLRNNPELDISQNKDNTSFSYTNQKDDFSKMKVEEEDEVNTVGTSVIGDEDLVLEEEESPKKNLNQLVTFARQKTKELEEITIQEFKNKKEQSMKINLAMADVIQSRGGIVQKGLRTDKKPNGLSFMEDETKEVARLKSNLMEAGFKLRLEHNGREQIYVQNQERLNQAQLGSPYRLTNSELTYLQNEFEVNSRSQINIGKVDEILQRLKFFSQLTKEVRVNFYENAMYLREPVGTYVLYPGAQDDLMYVILKGGVNVKVDKHLDNGIPYQVIVASLYDGSHFGELATAETQVQQPTESDLLTTENLEGQKEEDQEDVGITERLLAIDNLLVKGKARTYVSPKKRAADKVTPAALLAKGSASVQCVEETEILAINKVKFQAILSAAMQRDLDAKIRTLRLIPFLRHEDNFSLLPLANSLQTVTYKFGHRIIQAEDIIMNFYVVSQGRCKIVKEIVDEYALNVDAHKDKLRSFKFRDYQVDCGDKTRFGRLKEDRKVKNKQDISDLMRRTFDNEPFLEVQKRCASAGKARKFRKHVIFRELGPGDIFGFRPLLKGDEEENYIQDKENQAKLSVIADSPEVEVHVLPRSSFSFLPDRVKEIILEELAKLNDFDHCDIKKGVKEHVQWRKYQVNLMQDALTRSETPNLMRHRQGFKAT